MRLALVGDVMLGRLVNETLRTREPVCPWGDTLPLIRQAGWRFCNLECVEGGQYRVQLARAGGRACGCYPAGKAG